MESDLLPKKLKHDFIKNETKPGMRRVNKPYN